MLTNFENFNFSFVKFKIFRVHLFLLQNLNSNFLSCFLVNTKFNPSELSFTNRIFNFIMALYVLISYCLLNLLHPISMILLIQIIKSSLFAWKYKSKRIHHSFIVVRLWFVLSHKYITESIHSLLLFISLFFEEVEILIVKFVPISFQFSFARFSMHQTFEYYVSLFFFVFLFISTA